MRSKKRPVERENRIFGAITLSLFLLGVASWIIGEASGQTKSGGLIMASFFLAGVLPLFIYLFKNRKRR